MSVVFLAFATSGVSFIKLFGVGLTVAVLLDAFVIRGTLVPAFMRLAGEANWWAPAPLRRFHDRFGISEHVVLDAASSQAAEPGAAPAPSFDLRPVPSSADAPSAGAPIAEGGGVDDPAGRAKVGG